MNVLNSLFYICLHKKQAMNTRWKHTFICSMMLFCVHVLFLKTLRRQPFFWLTMLQYQAHAFICFLRGNIQTRRARYLRIIRNYSECVHWRCNAGEHVKLENKGVIQGTWKGLKTPKYLWFHFFPGESCVNDWRQTFVPRLTCTV